MQHPVSMVRFLACIVLDDKDKRESKRKRERERERETCNCNNIMALSQYKKHCLKKQIEKCNAR